MLRAWLTAFLLALALPVFAQSAGSPTLPLYPATAAEVAGAAVVTNITIPPGYVTRYGCDSTGAVDCSTAFLSALAQRKQKGEPIVFPAGLYKGNFVVTGQYIDIRFEHFAYEDVATVGFIANNNANPIWQIGDGSTTTTSIRLSGGLKIHGQSTAAKCLLIQSASNVFIDGLISRGCTTYSVSYTASTTVPAAYVYISNYRIDIPSSAPSAIGLVMTQPANYPTSYATALYLHNGALLANSGSLWGVQINANSRLWVSNSYWTMINNAGIDFSDAGGSGQIIAENLFIDTLGTSNDVLITSAANQSLAANLYGQVSINGKISINGVTSAAALTNEAGLSGYRAMLFDNSVAGYLDFQDGSLGWQDQSAQANQPISLSRNGGNFFIKNTAAGGSNNSQAAFFQFTDTAGANPCRLYVGSGSPAGVVAANPCSVYLNSAGGAATTLYVKESGTGTSTGWVGK
jgi:hypothetical protein